MDIHSYYNGLLYSYGYKEKAVPDNIEEIIAMAEKAVTAIPEMKAVKASALGNTYALVCKQNLKKLGPPLFWTFLA